MSKIKGNQKLNVQLKNKTTLHVEKIDVEKLKNSKSLELVLNGNPSFINAKFDEKSKCVEILFARNPDDKFINLKKFRIMDNDDFFDIGDWLYVCSFDVPDSKFKKYLFQFNEN